MNTHSNCLCHLGRLKLSSDPSLELSSLLVSNVSSIKCLKFSASYLFEITRAVSIDNHKMYKNIVAANK